MARQIINRVSEQTIDNLIHGAFPRALTFGVSVRGGQGVLARGAVLGLSSKGGYVLLGTEPTETPAETIAANCILADPLDAGGEGAAMGVAYRTGHFNRNALIVKEGYTLTATDEEELRRGGILLSDAKN